MFALPPGRALGCLLALTGTRAQYSGVQMVSADRLLLGALRSRRR